jgi:hypothetical protein
VGKEDEIRLIAYNIWKQEGCINGKDREHWFRAEAIWQGQQKFFVEMPQKPFWERCGEKIRFGD